jgi:phosphohistidine swiveling domain-containing protein
LRTVLPAVPVAIGLEVEFNRCLRDSNEYLTEFDSEEARFKKDVRALRSMPDGRFVAELKEILFDFYVRTEKAYFRVIYNNANAQTELKSLIRAIDKATKGETEVVRLLGGLSDVAHIEMQRDLLVLFRQAKECGTESAAFERSLHVFLERNYFHGDAELELMTPRWAEDPNRVVEMIEGMLSSQVAPADPERTIARQKEEYAAELELLEERLGRVFLGKARFSRGLKKRLERARAYLSLREAMRERSSKAYALIRLFILEAARRWTGRGVFQKPDEIFMLELPEIRALIADPWPTDELRRKISFRRAMYDGYSEFLPPNELGRGIASEQSETTADPSRGEYLGLGCSSGRVIAPARVIMSLSQMGEIRPGEILVTRFTDPGWTPVLGIVRGVVTEVGGMLSHAAVIGREYGIPAVLNLKSATALIRTGDMLEIDGSSGSVRVVEGALANPVAKTGEDEYHRERQIEEGLSEASFRGDSEGSLEQGPELPAR